jgi:hypothetical protein
VRAKHVNHATCNSHQRTDAWYTTVVSWVNQLFLAPFYLLRSYRFSLYQYCPRVDSIGLPFVVQTLNATSLFDSIFRAIKGKATVTC